MNELGVSPQAKQIIERANRDEHLETLKFMANTTGDLLSALENSARHDDENFEQVTHLLGEMQTALAVLHDKKEPELPDFAQPVVDAVATLQKEFTKQLGKLKLNPTISPQINVESPDVNVDVPKLDLSGVERIIKNDLADALAKAVTNITIPEQKETDFTPVIKQLKALGTKLDDIETASRLKPQFPTSINIPKLSGATDSVRDVSTIEYYSSPAGGRLAYNITTDFVTVTGSAEQALALLENPAGSGKDVYIWYGEFQSTINTKFRRYSAPIVNTRGTAKLPRSLSAGTTPSVLRFYRPSDFTLSNVGTISKTALISNYQQYLINPEGRTVLRPGSAVYWTIDQPANNPSFDASIYFEYYELVAQ